MKHIYIDEYGTFLGKTGNRLAIYKQGELLKEIALSRVRSVNVFKSGVSISSDLIESCSLRGIKIFFLDFKNVAHTCLVSTASSAVAAVRKSQFACIETGGGIEAARALIIGKIKNQRATLQYFYKYEKTKQAPRVKLQETIESLKSIIATLKEMSLERSDWLSVLLGKEGGAASLYFSAIGAELLSGLGFSRRIGRGAQDLVNASLNYGYAVLHSYVWQSIINAGLEPFAGVLHTNRPGKPSLVLDVMEEYRSWVVDRNIIKLKAYLKEKSTLDAALRKRIIQEINLTMSKKYPYHGRLLSLSGIMQRQVYKLTGYFMGRSNYKSYIFKW